MIKKPIVNKDSQELRNYIVNKDTTITVPAVRDNIPSFTINFKQNNGSSFSLLGVLTPGVAFILFVITQYINSRQRRKDRLNQWYHKAILEPALIGINELITNTGNLLDDFIKDVNRGSVTNTRKIKDDFKLILKEFENKHQPILSINNQIEFNKVNNLLLSFDDDVSGFLDQDFNDGQLDLVKLKGNLTYYHTELLKIFLSPIRIIKSKGLFLNRDFSWFYKIYFKLLSVCFLLKKNPK